MGWYKFWKKSGPMQGLDEKYVWLDKESYPTKESVKSECENWAERIPGGHNSHYSFGFRKIKLPPKNVLEQMIEHKKEEITNKRKELKFLEYNLNEIKQK